MEFHNPYNFIPALPRGEGGGLMPPGLRDGEPAGHHRWQADRYSGRIAITIEVRTPLLLMTPVDPPPGIQVPEGHRHLDVATSPDQEGVVRVDLAPTQIKGMLRSAFEAVTNSRLGVFDQDQRLGYRTAAKRGPDRLPALILIKNSAAQLHVLLDEQRGGKHPVVAKLPVWKASRKGAKPRPELLTHDFLRKGLPVLAVVSGRSRTVESLHDPVTSPGDIRLGSRQQLVRGWPHITGRSANAKRSEYLFITAVWQGNTWVNVTPLNLPPEKRAELIQGYRELVAEQRSVHRHDTRNEVLDRDDKAAPWDYLGDEPGRTAWSRHLYDLADLADHPWNQPAWLRGDLTLPDPDSDSGPPRVVTCWAEIKSGRAGFDVVRLTPVTISRALHGSPPRDLLHPSLRPAERMSELSPADRVFGWVSQQGSTADDGERAAGYRGQLRIVDLVCPTRKRAVHNLGAGGVTIAPLSTPKPSQGLFYVGNLALAGAGGTVKPLSNVSDRSEYFPADPGQGVLRGRKVYPHQQKLTRYQPEKLPDAFRYHPPDGQAAKTSQNATLHGWVKPGARFQAVIQVDNLHPMELGALLWLLDPERIGRDGAEGLHRLGMGKPLGFGSVDVRVNRPDTRLSTGRQVADRFRTLADAPETTAWEHLAEEFEQAMARQFPSVLTAMRNAAVGFPAHDRVHYPRSVDGEPGYEWFVANDQAMHDKHRQPQALPALDQTPLKPLKGYR